MNTYRLIRIKSFPRISEGEECQNSYNFALPGFTEDTQTKIRFISQNYYGYKYYEIEHEMLIKERGLAYGFVDDKPAKMELNGYKKSFNIKMYIDKTDEFAFLSESSNVIKDLLRTLKKDETLGISFEELDLDFVELEKHIEHYTGAWFKGVSSRVTSSALFGADLSNEPLFKQLKEEGAVSSITIPFGGMQISLSKKVGISSHQNLRKINDQLELVSQLKEEVLDFVIKPH